MLVDVSMPILNIIDFKNAIDEKYKNEEQTCYVGLPQLFTRHTITIYLHA